MSTEHEQRWPAVSVVIPMRNEADFIARSLGAMRRQDYLGELEFVCVDAMSSDGTRELIAQIARQDPRVRLVDNPDRNTPAGMNHGIAAARHELVLRMDAHAIADSDYITRSVELMTRTGADNVGGRWTILGTTYFGRAVAAALASRFGAGTAPWRGSKEESQVDTVPFGCWRRELLLELGGFDETLVRNQDYELNYRIRARGGVIYFSPRIHSRYFTRTSLRRLWRQYFDYGLWKARVIKRHPRSARPRHLVAPAFVLGIVAGLPLVLLCPACPTTPLYFGGLASYAAANLAATVMQGASHGWELLPALPVVFGTLHIGWGTGFLKGALTSPASGSKPPRDPERER